MASPDFTVVMATWNRGRHILPSVRSVLAQSHRSFELLVVGDDVTDDTAVILDGLENERLRWINNAPRWGTQSGPNNRGISEARGAYVAYIGHDDIWDPGHLAALAKAARANPEADAVVSGLIVHRLNTARPFAVCGLLNRDDPGHAERCFVQPSATAHRLTRIRQHPWPRAENVDHPVDLHLQLELVQAGTVFASTGEITVHKFTAAGRYLSYFDISSVEQEVMLELVRSDSWPSRREVIVAKAKATGDYMAEETRQAGKDVNRDRLARLKQVRGISGLPENLQVGGGISLLQSPEPRTPDWQRLQDGQAYRFTGPNPRPKMLLPLLSDEKVELRLFVRAGRRPLIRQLRLWLNGQPVPHRIECLTECEGQNFAQVVLSGDLRTDRASILTIEHLDKRYSSGEFRRGIAVAAVSAVPL